MQRCAPAPWPATGKRARLIFDADRMAGSWQPHDWLMASSAFLNHFFESRPSIAQPTAETFSTQAHHCSPPLNLASYPMPYRKVCPTNQAANCRRPPAELSLSCPPVHGVAQQSSDAALSCPRPAKPWVQSSTQGRRNKIRYKCGHCGQVKPTSSGTMNGRTRVRCECGGHLQDGIPRLHSK